ncbi:DUF285 domain-containing protein [Enterococcus hirae]|nr:DUF285 domain-containing protein [Enterococcus hirae]
MFAVAGVMGNTGIAPTMALADTLTPTAETATEQTQANEAKEVIDQTIQNVTDPLVNPTDSTTTASDSLATTDETTDDTQDQATEQEQATAPTAESEGDATNPTAEAPKVAKKANVVAASEITGTWGTSPYTFDENTGVLTIGAGELSGYTESPWSENKNVDAEAIKKIVLSGKVVAPKNSRLLFSGNTPAEKLTNVTEIEGLSQLDTSNVTDMSYMFFGMSSVTSLDVSSFDTSKVTVMSYMFLGMKNITNLDVNGWNTSNVTSMYGMFSGMSSVTSLDVSGFDTSNVTDMANMFRGMSSVTSLDVSGFDTSNVTTMENMFYNISSVTSLDLSVFDTSNVTTMQDMFKDTPLAKLTLGDHFKAVGDTKLSAPKALNEGDQLTGNWIREDGQSKGYSPADFMTNYGTGDLTAGTYVAELVKSELKPQEYHVGDVNITGTYTGDMSLGRLTVNGKVVSWGGSFKDGKFSYYVGNLKVSEDDQVVLMGANNRGQQIPGSEIDVTIQTPTAEINELTYKIGTQTIKGAYGSDTQVHQGHLFVNGKLISKGGSFKDGAISYYVKPDLIKADDQVTMNFYDGSGNLLAENQTVSVN